MDRLEGLLASITREEEGMSDPLGKQQGLLGSLDQQLTTFDGKGVKEDITSVCKNVNLHEFVKRFKPEDLNTEKRLKMRGWEIYALLLPEQREETGLDLTYNEIKYLSQIDDLNDEVEKLREALTRIKKFFGEGKSILGNFDYVFPRIKEIVIEALGEKKEKQ